MGGLVGKQRGGGTNRRSTRKLLLGMVFKKNIKKNRRTASCHSISVLVLFAKIDVRKCRKHDGRCMLPFHFVPSTH